MLFPCKCRNEIHIHACHCYTTKIAAIVAQWHWIVSFTSGVFYTLYSTDEQWYFNRVLNRSCGCTMQVCWHTNSCYSRQLNSAKYSFVCEMSGIQHNSHWRHEPACVANVEMCQDCWAPIFICKLKPSLFFCLFICPLFQPVESN